MQDHGITIRQAQPADAPELARHAVDEKTDRSVGYALFFHTYSTFLTSFGIWLEDLFVEESWAPDADPERRHHESGIGNQPAGQRFNPTRRLTATAGSAASDTCADYCGTILPRQSTFSPGPGRRVGESDGLRGGSQSFGT